MVVEFTSTPAVNNLFTILKESQLDTCPAKTIIEVVIKGYIGELDVLLRLDDQRHPW